MVIFSGGKPPARLRPMFERWAYPISRFLTAVNRENGSLSLDPFADYPSKTYVCYEILQVLFMEHIKAAQDKAIAKSRSRGAGRGK